MERDILKKATSIFSKGDNKFNDHYHRLDLTYPLDVQIGGIDEGDIKLIVDYLNLCTEEYFWFEKGRIEQNACRAQAV